jgi:hypothetical protein
MSAGVEVGFSEDGRALLTDGASNSHEEADETSTEIKSSLAFALTRTLLPNQACIVRVTASHRLDQPHTS